MGLDTVVVAFFVIGTILVLAGTLTMGTSALVESSYNGFTSASQTKMERLHTEIKINNTRIDGATHHIHLTVENTGETKLSNFDLWDLIVVKNGQASYLVKDNDYRIEFVSDIINPGILDPHESINIELLTEFDPGETVLIKIVTENGIVSSTNYIAGEQNGME